MSISIPTVTITYLTYQTEIFETDTELRVSQIYIFTIFMFMTNYFTGIDWLRHMIVRQGFLWITALLVIYHRAFTYKETNVVFSIIVDLFIAVGCETTLYINHRSKVKLFMQAKVELI